MRDAGTTMRLNRVSAAVLLVLLSGCNDLRYEHLDFADASFKQGGVTGSAGLRASFADEVDGLVRKASPYSLIISLPLSASHVGGEGWHLEQLVLTATESGEIVYGQAEPVEGEQLTTTDGEARVYFTLPGLDLPHVRLRLRFTLQGPDGVSTNVEVVFEPEASVEQSSSWLDRILSV